MTTLDFERTPMIIALDFDGTMVYHSWPELGEPIPGAFEWVRLWRAEGARIMLWTNRSHQMIGGREPLQEALDMFDRHGIELWGVNENPEQNWSTSHKQFAHLYVDDVALGCPTMRSPEKSPRPHVRWSKVGPEVLRLIQDWNAAMRDSWNDLLKP